MLSRLVTSCAVERLPRVRVVQSNRQGRFFGGTASKGNYNRYESNEERKFIAS